MTALLLERGWMLDLARRDVGSQGARREHGSDPMHRPGSQGFGGGDRDGGAGGVAVKMTFEGAAPGARVVGEQRLEGHHDYFLGGDARRWRTEVPLYAAVRYRAVYPGVDVRMRLHEGRLEYDVLCAASAELAAVTIVVEGADGLRIDADGALVIETALGPIRQPKPKTWECLAGGERRDVDCGYVLRDGDRFGFAVAEWDGARPLVIDPGLLWASFLGGSNSEAATAVAVDAGGRVTVAGLVYSFDFPTTPGAYDTIHNFNADVFVSRLIPLPIGSPALLDSTYIGGGNDDWALAMSVDASGVVTIAGATLSSDFPTTAGAFDTTYNGQGDAIVCRLDPRKAGLAQLDYSTFLGGRIGEFNNTLAVEPGGVITVAGETTSSDYPVSTGAYDTSQNGDGDIFLTRLDPRRTGNAQLVYSTFLGSAGREMSPTLCVDAGGVITVAGWTQSTGFPTTPGALSTRYGGGTWDSFVCRVDPQKAGSAQLVYSTFLGGGGMDRAMAVAADPGGMVTVVGSTSSFADFPVSRDAYDATHNRGEDVFITRLDPQKTGTGQLLYSTFLGGGVSGSGVDEHPWAASVDAAGVVTVVGGTDSGDFPVTSGAYDTTHNGPNRFWGDAFVSRLDPRRTGSAQLLYSTFLGGTGYDRAYAVFVDASGVATVAGGTSSADFPATAGAYDTMSNGNEDVFISRLDMGVAMWALQHEVTVMQGGTQTLTLDAGMAHANLRYWIFGSISGTTPGINLLGIDIPLNPDVYTTIAMGAANSVVFTGFKGVLDANGNATARFNVPANLPVPPGLTLHHAYVVYDTPGRIYMASNAVPLRLR